MAEVLAANAQIKRGYVRSFEANLFQKKAQLAYTKRKVRRAAMSGRIDVSEQLRNAEARADSALTSVDVQLQKLIEASDDSWEGLKLNLEMAWEEFSQSIKAIVARF